MNREELLRMVDSLHKDWEVDKELVFASLQEAFALAIKKQFSLKESPQVKIDRQTGEIQATDNGNPLDVSNLGRVAYQFVKQSFMQKLKDAKSLIVFNEYLAKQGTIVACKVVRVDAGVVECEIGRKIEAILPRSQQIQGETYAVGSRFKAYVQEVERRGSEIVIVLSRTDPRFVQKLFELEVPEILNGTCVTRAIAREPGYRTKLLVQSTNDRVDCVGACVGIRGSRIKNIVDELNGENIDVIPWSSDEVVLVKNAMKPAEVSEIQPDTKAKRAVIYVGKSQLSQAIGKGGRNVRLASRLTGWEIDVFEIPTAEQPQGTSQETESK